MSLFGSLQVGRSAILSNQSAIQVIGNNISNASNTSYTRQRVELSAVYGSTDYGDGVEVSGVTRVVDDALTQRMRQANSDTNYDDTRSNYMTQLEKIYNELTDYDLSSGLSKYFNSFSSLASTPDDSTARSTVIDEAQTIVDQIQTIRNSIINLNTNLTNSLQDSVDGINTITQQLAELNTQIANATSTGDTASALLDKRDSLLSDLSELTNIDVSEQTNGSVIVSLGGSSLVQGDEARQLQVVSEDEDGSVLPTVRFTDNNGQASIEGGKAGAINDLIREDIDGNLDDLDTFSSSLIFEVNKLHCSGQGLDGYSSISSSNTVTDSTAALNNAGLAFTPKNGSFKITLTDTTSNTDIKTATVNVDLNGLDGNDTTLNDLATSINNIDGLSASVTTDGQLKITSDSDKVTFTFSNDTSNILACLGINGFFTGSDASNIDVNKDLVNNPDLLACSQTGTSATGDGSNAKAIGDLTNTASTLLNGVSVVSYYDSMTGNLGSEVDSANQQYEIHSTISDSLQSQWDSVSGVNVDDETIDLMSYQRGFQGAAKFITTVNQLLDDIMQIF